MQANNYNQLMEYVNNFVEDKDVISTFFTTERNYKEIEIYYTAFIYYVRKK